MPVLLKEGHNSQPPLVVGFMGRDTFFHPRPFATNLFRAKQLPQGSPRKTLRPCNLSHETGSGHIQAATFGLKHEHIPKPVGTF